MMEMLDAWMKTHARHPTVAEALAQMQQHQLTNELNQRCTLLSLVSLVALSAAKGLQAN